MLRSIAFGKIAAVLALLALPLTTGCQSTGGGWGWSPWASTPSFSSMNPWKSKDSQLASSKPSNQVPTPPASMLAGSGMAKNAQTGAPTYNSNNFAGGRPSGGISASTNDYGARQVSATQGEGGYHTGPYSMGAAGATQNGPYNPSASTPYAGTATADRRADAAYGPSQTYSGSQGSPQSYGGYPATSGGQAHPAAGAPYGGAQSNSPYTGATGQSSGSTAGRYSAGNGVAATSNASSDGYRPGSTGRGADVQRTSYDNQGAASASGGTDYGSGYPSTGAAAYPTTGAGDDSAYR